MVQLRKVFDGRRYYAIILLMRYFAIGSSFVGSSLRNPVIPTVCNQSKSKGLARQNLTQIDGAEESKHNGKALLELLLPSKNCEVDQMSGTDLAYIGDVVFELFIRSRHVWPSKRTSDLQNIVVSTVRAEHQSELLEMIKSDFPLSDKELQVLMRGRNASTRSKNRRNPAAYQDSTSFEALIGYLYIGDQTRCTDLLNWLDSKVDQ